MILFIYPNYSHTPTHPTHTHITHTYTLHTYTHTTLPSYLLFRILQTLDDLSLVQQVEQLPAVNLETTHHHHHVTLHRGRGGDWCCCSPFPLRSLLLLLLLQLQLLMLVQLVLQLVGPAELTEDVPRGEYIQTGVHSHLGGIKGPTAHPV